MDESYLQTKTKESVKSWQKFFRMLGVADFPKMRKKATKVDTSDLVRIFSFSDFIVQIRRNSDQYLKLSMDEPGVDVHKIDWKIIGDREHLDYALKKCCGHGLQFLRLY